MCFRFSVIHVLCTLPPVKDGREIQSGIEARSFYHQRFQFIRGAPVLLQVSIYVVICAFDPDLEVEVAWRCLVCILVVADWIGLRFSRRTDFLF